MRRQPSLSAVGATGASLCRRAKREWLPWTWTRPTNHRRRQCQRDRPPLTNVNTPATCVTNMHESAHVRRRRRPRRSWICLAYTVASLHSFVRYIRVIHTYTRACSPPQRGERLLFNARAVGRVPVLSRVDPCTRRKRDRQREMKRERGSTGSRWIPS